MPRRRCSWATAIRSTVSQTCVVTRTYSTFGDIAAAGPRLWNSLQSHLKEADLSYNRFRRSIKTFLFNGAVWTILIAPFRNNLTYLRWRPVAELRWMLFRVEMASGFSCAETTRSRVAGRGSGKRVRTIFTQDQLDRLEKEFERQQYMVGTERSESLLSL